MCCQFRGAAAFITSPETLLPSTDPGQAYFWEAPWQSSPAPSNAGGAPCLQALLPLPPHPLLHLLMDGVSTGASPPLWGFPKISHLHLGQLQGMYTSTFMCEH